jgi:FAD:protein FMN transferase
MEEYFFQALGTKWSITLDSVGERPDLQAIFDAVAHFENRFSRFQETSEVNQFRTSPKGVYKISDDLAQLFAQAKLLQTLTNGIFDPVVAKVLEQAGYDAKYTLIPQSDIDCSIMPRWSIVGNILTIDGPIHFDFGGIGKGFCIDMIASMLHEKKLHYFLIEGGGDMYGTTKSDGSSFRIALEWPGKPDTAYGIVSIAHQGLAVSDSFKRRWKQWHHIVNPITKKPIDHIIGVTCIAPNAFLADCATSALFLTPQERHKEVYEKLSAEGVVFFENGTIEVSSAWAGEIFT